MNKLNRKTQIFIECVDYNKISEIKGCFEYNITNSLQRFRVLKITSIYMIIVDCLNGSRDHFNIIAIIDILRGRRRAL